MKRNKKICIIITALLIGVFILSQQENKEKLNLPYEYPVHPGMAEWDKLETTEEMVSACAIPEDVLDKMDTSILVETALNHPLMNSIKAYDSSAIWFDSMIEMNNALKELLSRKDAKEIVIQYKNNHPFLSSEQNDFIQIIIEKL